MAVHQDSGVSGGRIGDVLGVGECGQTWKGFDKAEGEASWEWAQQVQRPWGRAALQITHSLVEPKKTGAGAQEEVRAVERPQIKAGSGQSRGHSGPGARDGTQLTSDLPRLWPPVCQLGAVLRAQHAQPRGRSVHQRRGHSVRRGPGAGGQWLPHVAGKEKVCHRYVPTLLPPPSWEPGLCYGQAPPPASARMQAFEVFGKDRWVSGLETQCGVVTDREGWPGSQGEGSGRKMNVSGPSPGGWVSLQGSKARRQKHHCSSTLTLFSCPHRGLLGSMGQ